MATVHRLRAGQAEPTLAEAIAAYLATLDHPENAGTRRVYAGTLASLRAELGAGCPVADLGEPAAAERLSAWFTARWGQRAPATFNRNLDALRAAVRYWHDQGFIDPVLIPPAACAAAAAPSTAPRPWPATRSRRCWAAPTSACGSGPCGACSMRPPPAPAKSSPSTSKTWTCATAAPRSGARAAPST